MREIIIVLTKDWQWCSQLLHNSRLREYEWIFGTRVNDLLEPRSPSPDLTLVDVNLLPPPESANLFQIHHFLRMYYCVAVYTPGTQVQLIDVRKAFIAGAQDLVEKPCSRSEMVRLLKLSRRGVETSQRPQLELRSVKWR